MGTRRAFLSAALVLGLFVSAGCAGKDETASTPEAAAPQPATPTPTAEAPAGVAGNAASLVAELRQHESELAEIVEQGRLGEVHGKVVAIVGLLTAAADRATDLPETSRAQLREQASAAQKIAGALHEAGDAGDMSATKLQLGHLQAELREVEKILGARP